MPDDSVPEMTQDCDYRWGDFPPERVNMFVAWRDLSFARGRFLLLAVVVALISLLIGFLAGLTAGLGNQSVSAIQSLEADQFVMSQSGPSSKPSFSDSAISREQALDWERPAGEIRVQPLGIGQTEARSGDAMTGIAIFGAESGSWPNVPGKSGDIVLSDTIATDLGGLSVGSEISIAGRNFRVAGVSPDDWHSHLPVAWMTLGDWQEYQEEIGAASPFATVLAAVGDGDYDAGNSVAGTTSVGGLSALLAIGSFSSEVGSLLLIVAMLFVISAVVIGAFFTVWMIQRSPDIAILKALGAKQSVLLKDALGQALLVLSAGVILGMGTTVIFG